MGSIENGKAQPLKRLKPRAAETTDRKGSTRMVTFSYKFSMTVAPTDAMLATAAERARRNGTDVRTALRVIILDALADAVPMHTIR